MYLVFIASKWPTLSFLVYMLYQIKKKLKNCYQRMINSFLVIFFPFLKIRWWLVGENIKSANDTIVGKETYGMVYGISKGYVYALRVLGFSKGGDGKMSPTQYFTLGKCNVARSQL